MATTVERIRSFNRTWTEVLGLLERRMHDTEFTLTEGRVLFELGQCTSMERQELRQRLQIDPSFLTRILKKLERNGLLTSIPSAVDRRALVLALTDEGRKVFDLLDRLSTEQIDRLLAPLTGQQREDLARTTALLAQMLRADRRPFEVVLRRLQPGDLGWVVSRNGAIYVDQFGWNFSFEALVARVLSDYHDNFKPGRENGWIAEVNGARAGCVFCCERDSETAQLRVLLVEPWARGAGLGRRLVDECIAFAMDAGYARMMLWTVDTLTSARRIYGAAGFELVSSEPVEQFGSNMMDEIWELDLTAQRAARHQT